jgi:hypothetical protein
MVYRLLYLTFYSCAPKGPVPVSFCLFFSNDGTGILYDYKFCQRLLFFHSFSEQELSEFLAYQSRHARDFLLKEVEILWDFSPNEWHMWKLSIDDYKVCIDDITEPLRQKFLQFIWQVNNKLQYPIYGFLRKEGLSLRQGSIGELEKALCALYVLSNRITLSPYFFLSLDFEGAIDRFDGLHISLVDALDCIIHIFGPKEKIYEYSKVCAGRLIGCEKYGFGREFNENSVVQYFPSSRERLEVKEWLVDLLAKYGEDIQAFLP